MAEIDWACGPLDRWPLEPVPCLVEPWSGERQVLEGSRWFEPWPGSSTVPAGDADQVDIRTGGQPLGDFERRDSGAAGDVMPALFQCESDAQWIRHRPIMPTRVGATSDQRRFCSIVRARLSKA